MIYKQGEYVDFWCLKPMTVSRLPTVAFLPSFNDFGETYPLIEIAKNYAQLGGRVIFIGFKGTYDHYATDLGFPVIELERHITQRISERNQRLEQKYHYQNMAQERFYPHLFSKENETTSKERIEQEVSIFRREHVKLVVSAFNFTPLISARVAGVPLVTLVPGVAIPPYFESGLATFPEGFENPVTRLVPKAVKNRLANWYIARCQWSVKGFNRFAEMYGTPRVHRFLDLFCGDYTFLLDDMTFLRLKPTPRFPQEHFFGPLLPQYPSEGPKPSIDSEVERNLKKPGRSILVTIGSYGVKQTFLKILQALNNTDYTVLVSLQSIIPEDELPSLHENIIVRKFFPSIQRIHELVDLSIIHGGRGTVYTAAFSGKPVIGIPMHAEQQWNLDNLLRYGTGVMVSKKYFTEQKLQAALQEIFTNYDTYLRNAERLKNTLPHPNAASVAAQRIVDILGKEHDLRK
jgi:UDP:flavonoid glycosyltransferase YjiC (YdhE family)